MAQRRHRVLRSATAAGRAQPLAQLMIVVLTIYLAALGCWLGGIVFFSFFTAPAVFTVLPRPEAGQLISTIFPRYYMLGYIVGTISLVLAIYFRNAGAADMVGRHDGRACDRARNHLLCGHR